MNRDSLADEVSGLLGTSKMLSLNVIEAVLQGIKAGLIRGEDVTLTNFGTFRVSERAARTGRNPSTGEPIQIAPTRVATFKPGAGLKRELREGAKGAASG